MWLRRHALPVRLCHWVNVGALTILLMSGLQIFNAHPALYWGAASDFDHPFVALDALERDDGSISGETRIGPYRFDTTGVLGASEIGGEIAPRGFPAWITLPAQQYLAMGRRWHFFFAWVFVVNGLAYLAWSLASGHFRRDLIPAGREIGGIGQTFLDHLRLRFHHEGGGYNVLQKIAYLKVVALLLPFMAVSGMAMSPTLDAAFPWLLTILGGRQSARTLHFLCASGIVLFVAVHLVMVVLSGFWNNMRSMITGRFRVAAPDGELPR